MMKMGDVSFFLEKLIQKAKTTDDSLLSKIKDESFYNSLCDVCDVIGDLGFEFIESKCKCSQCRKVNRQHGCRHCNHNGV